MLVYTSFLIQGVLVDPSFLCWGRSCCNGVSRHILPRGGCSPYPLATMHQPTLITSKRFLERVTTFRGIGGYLEMLTQLCYIQVLLIGGFNRLGGDDPFSFLENEVD